MKPIKVYFIFFFTSLFVGDLHALTCAMSIGYQPYQYVEKGEVKGIDIEIIKLYNQFNSEKINVLPMTWKDAIAHLHFVKDIDCVIGMEISKRRKNQFHFTPALYSRYSSLFVDEKMRFEGEESLKGAKIGDDNDSPLSNELKKLPFDVRLIYVKSKEGSIKKLREGKLDAVIMPMRVGKYLSTKFKLKTKIVMSSKNAVPVGIATKKVTIRDEIAKGLLKIPKASLDLVINQNKIN